MLKIQPIEKQHPPGGRSIDESTQFVSNKNYEDTDDYDDVPF